MGLVAVDEKLDALIRELRLQEFSVSPRLCGGPY
jgi:hypothetical protein